MGKTEGGDMSGFPLRSTAYLAFLAAITSAIPTLAQTDRYSE
jgi:hypothetical protein